MPGGTSSIEGRCWFKHESRSTGQHALFNLLIPGITLFAVSGVLSVITILMLCVKSKKYPLLIYIQGIVLTGWIVTYCILSRNINLFHFTAGLIGLILMTCGMILNRLIVFDSSMRFMR